MKASVSAASAVGMCDQRFRQAKEVDQLGYIAFFGLIRERRPASVPTAVDLSVDAWRVVDAAQAEHRRRDGR